LQLIGTGDGAPQAFIRLFPLVLVPPACAREERDKIRLVLGVDDPATAFGVAVFDYETTPLITLDFSSDPKCDLKPAQHTIGIDRLL
jgi:hypothetical protein